MKKYLSIILFSFLSAYAFGCSPIFLSYFIEDGKMYFGQWRSSDKLEVFGVDTTTFVQDPKCSLYGKDKNHVYYEGQILPQANPDTFVFLGGIPTLAGEEGYSKDDKNVFFRNKRLEFADVSTFEVIPPVYNFASTYDDGYGKDKSHVYNYGSVLPVNVSSFHLLGWGYTADKSGIYYEGKLLEGSDSNNYQQKAMYLVTNNKVYFYGIECSLYDASTFHVLHINMTEQTSCGGILIRYTLTKDKNGVYINNELVDSLDGESITLENAVFLRDKNGFYQIELGLGEKYCTVKKKLDLSSNFSKVILDLEDSSFTLFNDGVNVYLIQNGSDKVQDLVQKYDVDAPTFKVYTIWGDHILFKDKKQFYVRNDNFFEVIPIDSSKAKLIYGNYRIDYIYSESKLYAISGNSFRDYDIDPETIICVEPDSILNQKGYNKDLILDKNNIYRGPSYRSSESKLTEDEYNEFKRCELTPAKVEEQRIKYLNKKLENNSLN